jgi:hypothetical protein
VDWWTEDCELVTEDCGQRFLIALSLARNDKLLDTIFYRKSLEVT